MLLNTCKMFHNQHNGENFNKQADARIGNDTTFFFFFNVNIVLTFFRREYTPSFKDEDLETTLRMNKPCSESDSFAAKIKESSTKPASGQVKPELHQ